MKLALIHDYLIQYGGAERVLEALHELWPEAPVYTSLYEPRPMPLAIRRMDVRTSFLQRLPLARRFPKWFFLLYGPAFERLDLAEYDVIFSVASFMAKSAIGRERSVHVAYCLTPPRFLWGYETYLKRSQLSLPLRAVLPALESVARIQDQEAAARVDHFVAISREVQQRIRKFYRREAAVIYPPVETARFGSSRAEAGDYFLVVARLGAYKRVDLAIEACTRLGLPLRVVGAGSHLAELQRLAGPTVSFLGRVDDADLAALYAGSRAVLFPGEDDFGLVPVEAQAAGRPVLALDAGGARETIVPGVTGELFWPPMADALAEVLSRFDPTRYDPIICRTNAGRFSKEIFQARIRAFVEGVTTNDG